MIKQTRWDKDMAKDPRVDIEMTQLMLGLEKKIMELVGKPLLYMDDTWTLKVIQRLNKIKATVCIKDIWHPEKQRKNDESIMEKISAIPGVITNQVEMANLCQVYLRILMVSDISNVNGTEIPPGRMLGKWRR